MDSPPVVELPQEFDRKELAPYPGGEMPIDPPGAPQPRWNSRRWIIWQLLHQGYTSKEAGEKAGYRNVESVRNLRKAWKIRYGINITAKRWDECANDPRYKMPVTAEDVAEAVNHDHLVIGNNARTLTQTWLSEFLGADDAAKARRSKLTPAEVAKIQEIGLNAERASQGLLEPPAKGKGAAAAPKPTSGAQKAVGALGAAPRRGPKGKQAEDAGSVVVGLRRSLEQFRQAQDLADQEAG